jgi:hypothetical protein
MDSRDVIKPESAPKLIEALNDQKPKVRIAAMRCLLKINRIEYIEPIERVAQADQDEKVRSYALRVASKLRETSKKNKIYNPIKLLIDDNLILLTVQPKFTFYTGYKDEAMVWKAGLLPIEIKLINLSDTHIRVNPNFCILISPAGTISKPLPYEKIFEKMQFSYKGGIISTVLFAPVGIGQLAKNKKINDKIRSNVGGVMLRSRSIAPNQEIKGCIFLNVPRDIQSLDNWRLDMGVLMSDGDIWYIENDFEGNFEVRMH